MQWELYLDESGDFEKGKQCLVGGILCPKNAISRETVLIWKREIQACSDISELMNRYPNWNYDHCSENKVTSPEQKRLRGEIQCRVLEEYRKRLVAIGGKIIVFNNPSGSYNIDNTTNFLTVLAKGLMLLFYDKKKEIDSLRLCFASRTNLTWEDNPEALPVSPTKVVEPGRKDSKAILDTQYVNQIKNLANLLGGQSLLDDPVFSDMLNSIEIMEDEERYNERHKKSYRANPLTVPCDYICNTFLNLRQSAPNVRKRLNTVFSPDIFLYYQTDLPIKIADAEAWNRENISGEKMMQLINADLPEPTTSRFIEDFNTVSYDKQRAVITYVREAMRDYNTNTYAMEIKAIRLKHAIDVAERMTNEQIRREFICNILLYQRSLYTHMGKHEAIQHVTERFHREVAGIEDTEITDELYNIADNNWLVILTDHFNLEQAVEEFDLLHKDWEARVNSRHRSQGVDEVRRFPVYGRTIGSYLQTLRHLIHLKDENSELYYDEARRWYARGRSHLEGYPNDISRYHQNVCDIESEMAHYQTAFEHLYKAAMYTDDETVESSEHIPITPLNAEAILHRALDDEKDMNPFILQHYVRMLSQACQDPACDDITGTLFHAYLPYIDKEIWNTLKNFHTKTQIIWKTASSLANIRDLDGQTRREAAELFHLCVQQLKESGEPVFKAIAIGVLAEQIWQIESGHIQGNVAVCLKNLRVCYQHFLATKSPDMKDPFDSALFLSEEIDTKKEKNRFLSESLKIGY